MKKIFTLLTILFIGNVMLANAQELKYIKDAAIVNDDGSLTMIPVEVAYTYYRAYSLVHVFKADGANSEVRVNAQDSITVKIKVRDINENPLCKINIYKAKKGKNCRRVLTCYASYRNKKADIDFTGETVGDCYYLLTIPAQEPGEYCIWYVDYDEHNKIGKQVVAFYGIDAE